MSATIYPNGLGGVLGDELVTCAELYTTGTVYFVHHTGDDANAGTREKPLATLVHANSLVDINDIVVLLDGHAETLSSSLVVSEPGVRIVGEGQADGKPTVRLTCAASDADGISITNTNVTIGNIWFPATTTLGEHGVIGVHASWSMVRGCYLEMGAEQETGIDWTDTDGGCRLYNTTIVSVSTTTPPVQGLVLEAQANCEVEACTFDGGVTGFSVGAIVGGLTTNFRAQQLRLMNGASISLDSDAEGYIGISEKSGDARVTGLKRRFANGFRQTGDALLADTEIYMSGVIYYVHYGTGDDGNSGIDELAPKKTLGSALLVALVQDFILLLPSHEEPISAALDTHSVGLTIIGCGTSDGKPSCRLYKDAAAGALVLFTQSMVSSLRNIWFDHTTSVTQSTSMVEMDADFAEMRGCLVTPAVTDVIGVQASGSFLTIRETKFESVAVLVSARPARGLSFEAEGGMSDNDVRFCIFSNATLGFTQDAFFEDQQNTRLYVIGATQSYGADIEINPNTTGMVNPETSSGSALVSW